MNTAVIKKIFIVDDDKLLTTMLSDYLIQKNDYQVYVFHSGEACLENLWQQPELIILDYYLNGVNKNAANGMEILELIKEKYPPAFIIVLSSQDRYSVARQSIQKGAENYVIKDKNAFETISDLINGLTY